MLSLGEQRIVNTVLRLCCVACIFPHYWDSETNRISVSPSRFKMCFVCANCTMLMMYSFFLVIRLQPGYGYTETEISHISFELVVHFFFIPVHFTVSVIQLFSIMYRHEFVTLFNQLYNFNAQQGKEYFGSEWRDRGSGFNEHLLCFFMGSLVIEAVSFCMIFIFYSQNRNYACSVFPGNGVLPGFICLLFETTIIYTAALGGAFYVVMGFNFVWSLNFWIKNACTVWLLEDKDVAESIRVYRALTYLSTLYNQSIARTCVPAMKTCIETVGIVMLFGALRLYENVDNLLYVVFPIGAILFLSQAVIVISLMAGVHQNSLKFRPNFQLQLHKKPEVEAKYWRRVVLSCRPIQCRIGTPYFVERDTKIKYARILLDALLWLLLSTKKNVRVT